MAVDTGGLEAQSSVGATVRVDCTAPQVAFGDGATAVVEGEEVPAPGIEVADAASGVEATALELSVDGGSWVGVTTPTVAEAGRTYVFRARAVDRAGNWSAWRLAPPVTGVAAPPPGEEPGGAEEPTPDEETEEAPREDPPEEATLLSEPVEVLRGPEVGVAPAPVPQQRPVEGARAAAPADPRLRISRVIVGRRRVRVAGTATPVLAARVRVAVTFGRRVRVKWAPMTSGRWRSSFARPGRRRPTRVVVRTPATPGFMKGLAVHPLR